MTDVAIAGLRAFEILDSRGRPTVRAEVRLAGGALGAVSVPSGASTGSAEARELRDGDRTRYAGLGCRAAVAGIEGEIARALTGRRFADQGALDRCLIDLDGTDDKHRLGANALLAVSLAYVRACAAIRGVPLFQQFAGLLPGGVEPPRLPRPTINLFSGGKHAGGQTAIQDVLLVPVSASTIDECLAMVHAVYEQAIGLCRTRYGMRALTADEGGLAPPFSSTGEMLECAVDAIRGAGLHPGGDVALAVDVASTQFFDGKNYRIDGADQDTRAMIDMVSGWLDRFPLVSVEDALAEDEWPWWPELCQRIGGRAVVVGDDLLCTRPARIERAIAAGAATGLLLKVNQIGTLTEAAHALSLARNAGWQVTVSARSGETEDDWLADLAVGWRGDQIKVGSIKQSERLAKYNRLLMIEREYGFPLNRWPRD